MRAHTIVDQLPQIATAMHDIAGLPPDPLAQFPLGAAGLETDLRDLNTRELPQAPDKYSHYGARLDLLDTQVAALQRMAVYALDLQRETKMDCGIVIARALPRMIETATYVYVDPLGRANARPNPRAHVGRHLQSYIDLTTRLPFIGSGGLRRYAESKHSKTTRR